MPLHSAIQNIMYEKMLEGFEQIQFLRAEVPEYQDYTDEQVANWIEKYGPVGGADDFYDWLPDLTEEDLEA